MDFWPARRLEWWEPRDFRRRVWHAEATSRHRVFLWGGVGLTLLGIGMGSLARTLNPKPNAPGLVVFLVSAVLGGMGMPWIGLLFRWLPTGVQLQKERCGQITGNTAQWVNYADCRDYGIIDQPGYQILVVGSEGGRNLAIGVLPTVDLVAVTDFLERQGLVQTTSEVVKERLPQAWRIGDNPRGFVA